MPKNISPSAKYSFAIGSVAAATLIRMLLAPWMGSEFPFFSYYVAVVLTSWYAGFFPSILAIVLGFIAGDLFFYARTSLEADPFTIFVYIITTFTIVFSMKTARESHSLSELSAAQASQRQKELQSEASLRKKAEEALRLSEESFRVVFELGSAGQALIDPADGRFLRVNAKLCQIVGYGEEELLNMTLRQIAYPPDNEWDTRTFRRMIEGQPVDDGMEKRYVCKGGRTIWCSVVTSIIRDQNGQPFRTAMAIREVTSRRRTEEALHAANQKLKNYAGDVEKQVAERTEKLTHAVHCLESFCFDIAREILKPIRAAHGYATVLARKCSPDAQALDYARHICQISASMEQMAEDLMSYGRISREPLPREPLHLGVLVNQALIQLAAEIESTKAQVEVEDPLPEVMGHPAALEQALLQLLRNAIKFAPRGITPQISIRADASSSMVRVWVIDNGVGIAPQFHEKIFNIFERLNSSEEGQAGTGIGLAIVKKAVERMGGRAGVVSEPGAGSRFWFELNKA